MADAWVSIWSMLTAVTGFLSAGPSGLAKTSSRPETAVAEASPNGHMKDHLRGQGRRGEDGHRDGHQVVRAPPRMSAGRTDGELHDLPPESPGAGPPPGARLTSETSVRGSISRFRIACSPHPSVSAQGNWTDPAVALAYCSCQISPE